MAALSQDQESPAASLPEETAHVSTLSPWLQLMLAEIARKRDEHADARAEAARRALEAAPQELGDRDRRDYVSASSEVHRPPADR
jgi:hypothetical protein